VARREIRGFIDSALSTSVRRCPFGVCFSGKHGLVFDHRYFVLRLRSFGSAPSVPFYIGIDIGIDIDVITKSLPNTVWRDTTPHRISIRHTPSS
jgi:hypothetical protein